MEQSIALKEAFERNDYQAMGDLFLADTKTKMSVEYLRHGKHFDDDTTKRDIYKVTFTRGQRSFSIEFGQSVADSRRYRNKHIEGLEYTCDGTAYKNGKRAGYKQSEKFLREFCAVIKGKEPSAYDVLSCLTKSDPGTFENFCSEYGYNEDSRRAERTYTAVCEEWDNVCKIWQDDEIGVLQEIA